MGTHPQPCTMYSANSPVTNSNLGFAPFESYSSQLVAPPFPRGPQPAMACRLAPNMAGESQGVDAIPTYDCLAQCPLKPGEFGSPADEHEADDMQQGGWCHTPSSWGD